MNDYTDTVNMTTTITREQLQEIGTAVRQAVVTGSEGQDCIQIATILHRALVGVGIKADIVGGGYAMRFGKDDHHIAYAFPNEWDPKFHLESHGCWLGHAWVRVGDLCLDTTTGPSTMGASVMREDAPNGLSVVPLHQWPFPDGYVFNAKTNGTVRDVVSVTRPTCRGITVVHHRNAQLTEEARRRCAEYERTQMAPEAVRVVMEVISKILNRAQYLEAA